MCLEEGVTADGTKKQGGKDRQARVVENMPKPRIFHICFSLHKQYTKNCTFIP